MPRKTPLPALGAVAFSVSRALGRVLRAGRYASVEIVREDGERRVRKRRLFHAPLLVWMGGPLVRVLDTGVRVLPQGEWEEREKRLYESLYHAPVRIEPDGTLVLPFLPGATLAALLEGAELEEPARKRAIALGVAALAELHRSGFTHGDAMAENVMVDLEAGAARWFDFETVHDPRRPLAWRRADDLRALLATSLLRTRREKRGETLRLVLEVYGDEGITPLLAASFASVWRRPLPFHLGQAASSFGDFRDISHLLEHHRAGRDASTGG